ncbi:ATP-binding cassette domain-containing protein [bacterium]|nr:ATP-binding cassette domain-containing protein [bacterium]
MIIFENVFKSYKGEEVLENIDFKVKRGEFVFLIGPSGAGKSTIIKLLNREEFPTSGKIFIDGTDLSTVPFEEMHKIRRKIGVVFQDFRVIKSKNVFENVAISLEVVNSPTDVIQEVVPNILGMVGLQNKIYKNPSELSGGEVQRLIIARALAHEPDIIVADEPTGMIDPRATGEIMNLLNEINKMGTTVLMATHDYNIVNHYKKRVLKIDNGKIVSDKKGGTYHD